MKRFICALLCLALSFSFVSCAAMSGDELIGLLGKSMAEIAETEVPEDITLTYGGDVLQMIGFSGNYRLPNGLRCGQRLERFEKLLGEPKAVWSDLEQGTPSVWFEYEYQGRQFDIYVMLDVSEKKHPELYCTNAAFDFEALQEFIAAPYGRVESIEILEK